MAEVIEPSLVVQTFGDLYEHIQVVRAQIELAGRASKEKAAVGPELSFRIFAPVAADFAGGGLDAHGQGAVRAAQQPDEYVAGAVWQRAINGRWHAHGIAELADGLLR